MTSPLNRQELVSTFQTATDQQGAIQSAKNYLLLLLQQQAAQAEFGVIGAAVPEADHAAVWAIRADGVGRRWSYAGKGNGEEVNLLHDSKDVLISHLAGVLEHGELLTKTSDFFSDAGNFSVAEMEVWGKEGLNNIRARKAKP